VHAQHATDSLQSGREDTATRYAAELGEYSQ
jgi:hypothetical protein